MGELLFFDDVVCCHGVASRQTTLFDAYVATPEDVGIVVSDNNQEWVVLVGDALLFVPKSADVRISNASDELKQ